MAVVKPRFFGTLAALGLALCAHAAPAEAEMKPCRLKGVEHEARCGSVTRPLDPARPQGPQVQVHFAVLPALAQRKTADPVFFFAGGPGQSAMTLAGPLSQQFARLNNRRDLVFVDQRGTGRSAPLKCPEDAERQPPQPLALLLDQARQLQRLAACRGALQQLPHGDLRQYTTSIAVADIDAVREALGAAQINAIGFSYGTRAVLEYQRQFPQRVRRAVLDGVAPPDMALPDSFSTDNQAALEALFAACEKETGCQRAMPRCAHGGKACWRPCRAKYASSIP
jgi:pimeloyl-ACP methyl ester carboxylesterase